MCVLMFLIVLVLLMNGGIMSKVDDLLTAVAALKAEEDVVLQYITAQALKLAEVSAQLQALIDAGNVDPKIQEATDSINAVVADLQAKITPPEAPVV